MINELVSYIDANHGKIENITLEDNHTLMIMMESVYFNTSLIEKIMDNNSFLEGLCHNYENVVIFDISAEDESQIAKEISSI